jgi:hypothetical protein
MCHLSKKDQYVCQSNHRIAEAVTGVLGGAQFSSGPFYHPRSSRGRFGHPREAAVCAGNFPDSNSISGDFKRQNRSHPTEPVPCGATVGFRFRAAANPICLGSAYVKRLQAIHKRELSKVKERKLGQVEGLEMLLKRRGIPIPEYEQQSDD